jgi:type II secretory pathway pseudopilin PulG
MRRPARSEDGETLAELIVAVAVLGVAVVALLTGFGTAIMTSGLNRTDAGQAKDIRDYAEALQQATYVTSCPATYTALTGYTPPANSTVTVNYWNGTGYTSGCGADTGLQKLTIAITPTDTRAPSETLDIIKRRPCSDAAFSC